MTKPAYRTPHYGFIYAIRHNPTKKVYVGITEHNPAGRLSHHIICLRMNKHSSKLMQEDFNQYGEDYSFFILEKIPSPMYKYREKYWQLVFRTYDPNYGYNQSTSDARPPMLEHFEEFELNVEKRK